MKPYNPHSTDRITLGRNPTLTYNILLAIAERRDRERRSREIKARISHTVGTQRICKIVNFLLAKLRTRI